MPNRAEELRAEQLRREQARRWSAPRGLPSRPTAEAAAQDREIRQGLRSAGGTFVSNFLSIPHAAGELLAAGAAVPQTLAGSAVAAARGQPINIGERFASARSEQERKFPASALLAIPDPSSEDVLAVPGAITGAFNNANANARRAQALWRDPSAPVEPMKDPRLGATYAESLAQEQQRSANHPISTAAGRVGGDVATMLTLRPGERATTALGMNPRATLPEGTKFSKFLARGAARATEAGIDGAAIAAMGDGDPVKAAAYTAGTQALASAALGTKGWVFGNLGTNAVRLWLGHEIWKAVMPGPQQAMESKDQVIQEIVGSYVAGTAAAMLGGGRGFGEGRVRQVSDLASTASRGAIASIVTQLQESQSEGNGIPAKVLELMSVNPDHFGSEARARLERAVSSDKPQALLREIESLMGSSKFREALDSGAAVSGETEQTSSSFGNWLMTGGRF